MTTESYPRIKLSQHVNIQNDDAYVYFQETSGSDEDKTSLPRLLSNKRKIIHLDELKRLSHEHLLLIKGKYELPFEVPTALMESGEPSLTSNIARAYFLDNVENDELNPTFIMDQIDTILALCSNLKSDARKVMGLWIYSTYFHTLFKSGYPYLSLVGRTLDKERIQELVAMLSLNAKTVLDISESALYRTVTFEGGTLIITNAEGSLYKHILKGGYSDNAYVYRTNMDKGGAVGRFSVFGPKVISFSEEGTKEAEFPNSRSIGIFTSDTEGDIKDFDHPSIYKDDHFDTIKTLTSHASLSFLEHFQEVNRLFVEVRKEIDEPIDVALYTMARFVGSDYEDALKRYLS